MKKMDLETKLQLIKHLVGGTTVFKLGIKNRKIEFISVEKCFDKKEKEEIYELEEPEYIG